MERIACDPEIMGGRPCIRGTRIPVSAVMSFWDGGYSASQILDEYPSLTVDDVRAARAWTNLWKRPPVNPMLERAAAALLEAETRYQTTCRDGSWFVVDHGDSAAPPCSPAFDTGTEADAECDRIIARAVIASLRDPTEDVVDAGTVQLRLPMNAANRKAVADIHRAMIDKILEG